VNISQLPSLTVVSMDKPSIDIFLNIADPEGHSEIMISLNIHSRNLKNSGGTS
jgi:hypothetical protein